MGSRLWRLKLQISSSLYAIRLPVLAGVVQSSIATKGAVLDVGVGRLEGTSAPAKQPYFSVKETFTVF